MKEKGAQRIDHKLKYYIKTILIKRPKIWNDRLI